MQVSQILTEIDLEIARLQQARDLLAGKETASSPAVKVKRKTRVAGKRKLTAEGRRKISEAMTRRWAERRQQAAGKTKRGTKTAK
jgi:phage-related tail fiber protein